MSENEKSIATIEPKGKDEQMNKKKIRYKWNGQDLL
jgi:hypothetical protein